MRDLQRISPLAQKEFVTQGFELRELPFVSKVRVQSLRRRGEQISSLNTRFPVTPNSVLGDDPIVLWKAPNEWFVYSLRLSAAQVIQQVDSAASGTAVLATDVSSGSVLLELRGPRAIEVLLRDCTLDLEGDAVKPGACAQTAIAQVPVMLHRTADENAWRLFVERSVAAHVWQWLSDTAL